MNIADFLKRENVHAALPAQSLKGVLQTLAELAEAQCGLNARALFDILNAREQLGTTGIGNGIAIPHGKPDGLDNLCALFARLETPIDYGAIDGKPVDIVFLLLAPETAGAQHLKALARISRLMRQETIITRLRAAQTAETLYTTLTATDADDGVG